jgi:hypothetical protein
MQFARKLYKAFQTDIKKNRTQRDTQHPDSPEIERYRRFRIEYSTEKCVQDISQFIIGRVLWKYCN